MCTHRRDICRYSSHMCGLKAALRSSPTPTPPVAFEEISLALGIQPVLIEHTYKGSIGSLSETIDLSLYPIDLIDNTPHNSPVPRDVGLLSPQRERRPTGHPEGRGGAGGVEKGDFYALLETENLWARVSSGSLSPDLTHLCPVIRSRQLGQAREGESATKRR